MGAGRPKKTLKTSGLPENWKEIIILESMQGRTDVEIRAKILRSMGDDVNNITRLWYALKEREEEFCETIKICKGFQEAWWVNVMREQINKPNFHAAPWIFTMKNLFRDRWKDRVEVEHDVADELLEKYKDMTADELIAKSKDLARIVLETRGDDESNQQAQIPEST